MAKNNALIDLLLFLLSVGLLSYFSESHRWILFGVCLVFAAILLWLKAHLTSQNFRNQSKQLIRAQSEFAARFEQSGIRSIFNMYDTSQQDQRNELTQKILKSGERFSLCTLTAASYIDPALNRHSEVLRERLEDGCSFRLLILNPFCSEKRVRDRRNDAGTVDSKLDIRQMAKLSAKYGAFEVRVSDINIYGAIFFSEKAMTYDPYHLGKRSTRLENRFICLALDSILNEESSAELYYEVLKDHFEFLWNEAVTLDQFLSNHEDTIGQYIGECTKKEIYEILDRRKS